MIQESRGLAIFKNSMFLLENKFIFICEPGYINALKQNLITTIDHDPYPLHTKKLWQDMRYFSYSGIL